MTQYNYIEWFDTIIEHYKSNDIDMDRSFFIRIIERMADSANISFDEMIDILSQSEANEEFREEDHPRDEDGKFTSKGSGLSSSKARTKKVKTTKRKTTKRKTTKRKRTSKNKLKMRSSKHKLRTYKGQKIVISDATNQKFVDAFTEFWNNDPSVKAMRKHINYVGLLYRKHPKGLGGYWINEEKKVVIRDYPWQTLAHFKSTTVHEIVGHTFWHLSRTWNRNALIEFNELANSLPPVNQYVKDNEEKWRTWNDEKQAQFRELDKKYGLTEDSEPEYLPKDKLEKWQEEYNKIDDGQFISNPSNKALNRDSSSMTRYANEQHSAITEIMYGTLNDSHEKGAKDILISEEDLEKLKQAWIKLHPRFEKRMNSIGEVFREEDHPRDKDGKFTSKGSGSSVVLEDEIKDHIPEGEIVGDVTIKDPFNIGNKFTIEWGEMEDAESAIEDFRDKNNLWRELELNPKNDKDQEMTVEGEMLEEAMKQWGKTDYPSGSVYLTRDGTWVGGKSIYGYDEDHRPQIRKGLTYAGIKIEHTERTAYSDSSSQNLTDGLNISGMIRARASPNEELALDISHPITSSQRRAIQDFMIENDLSQFNLIVDLDNKMKDKNENTISRSLSYESYSKEEFREEDHPRDEDGKFISKGDTSKQHKSFIDPEEDLLEHIREYGLASNMTPEKLTDSSKRNIKNIKHHEEEIKRTVYWMTDHPEYIEVTGMSEYEIKHAVTETFDPHKIAYDESTEFKHTPDELKQMWIKLGEENFDIVDRFVEMERGVAKGNEITKQLFEKSESFFRGTDKYELDDMAEDGIAGNNKRRYEDEDEPYTHKFDFTAVTPHRDISNIYGDGVTIEFDGDSVRKLGTPIKYDYFWRDFGARKETEKGEMHPKYMDHHEVRMPTEIPLSELKIKKIYISKYILDDLEEDAILKYSKLGEVEIIND